MGVAYGRGETGRALVSGGDGEGERIVYLSVERGRQIDNPCLIVNHKHRLCSWQNKSNGDIGLHNIMHMVNSFSE